MRQLRDPEQVALMPMIEGESRRALDALPDEFKLAVVLCDVEELSYQEIAEIRVARLATVMSRLHRGRKLLQRAPNNHALAMGIIKGEDSVGSEDEKPADSRRTERRSEVQHDRGPATDLS
jgi:RNA polymerase sigma-70 factor (ECF subfamily)